MTNECGIEPLVGWDSGEVRPECTHPEHWLSVPAERGGWLDWDDAPAECRWAQVHNYCDKDQGHDGPHHWPGLCYLVRVIELEPIHA